MKTLTIGTLLGASLLLGACKKSTDSGSATTAEEAKKSDTHVLATKGSKFPAKGASRKSESVIETKDAKMNIEAAGQKMDGTMNTSETSVETWVSLGDNKARRTLESKVTTGAMTMNGQDQPMPQEKDALIGVPVLVEFKNGSYVATLESGTPTADQTKALEKLNESGKNDSDFEMYGDTPRKVGDKWNVDPKKLSGFGEAKDLTGTFTTEFVEIKDFQGTPCAVLKSKFDLSGGADMGASPDAKMKVTLKGDATSYRSLADKTDLEAKINATMTMEGSPNPQVKMNMEGPFSMSQKNTIKKP
jgi:hypothetical protein